MDRAQSDGAFQTALTLAAAALALSLGGIWIGNVQFMRILDDGASSVFAMRTISLVLYGLFLIVAILVQKTHSKAHSKSIGTQTSEADALRREKTTMTSFMVVGLCLFVVAFLLDEFTSHALLALVLSKVVGLPLTIAVVLLFGRLPRTPMSRWIMLGSLGGFIVSALSISAAGILKMSFSGVVVLAFVLIAVSAACIRLGYSTLIRAKESDAHAASGPHPVERSLPLTQAVTPIFAIALVIASLMLGYAQGSFTSIATANGIPVAISLVGAAIVLRLGFRDASTSFFFQAGLVCAAVSALLGTAHAGWASVASDITVTLASAMFESVVYILSAWAVLRAQSKIVAAALARFLVVLGHFGGTLLTTMESTLIALNIQSENASAITVLSLFILLLVAIYRVPSLQSMLLGSAEGADTGQGIPTHVVAHRSWKRGRRVVGRYRCGASCQSA